MILKYIFSLTFNCLLRDRSTNIIDFITLEIYYVLGHIVILFLWNKSRLSNFKPISEREDWPKIMAIASSKNFKGSSKDQII